MKQFFTVGFLSFAALAAAGCGGPTTGSTAATGEITAEERAAIDAQDKAVEDAEKAHSSGK